MKLLLAKKTNFVGTKALCSAIKLIINALKVTKTRNLIKEQIPTLLYEIALPMMLITE